MAITFKKWVHPKTNQIRIYVNGAALTERVGKVWIEEAAGNEIDDTIIKITSGYDGAMLTREDKAQVIDRLDQAGRELIGVERGLTWNQWLSLAS